MDQRGKVFVADTWNSAIRMLSPAGMDWMVSAIAGGPGTVVVQFGLSPWKRDL